MKIAGIANEVVAAIHRGPLDRWLNPTEASAFSRLASTVSNDWLAGRIALKQACLDQLDAHGADPVKLTVTNSLSGVPHISELPGLRCSIAHSSGWGVAAVSNQYIGVDIERIKSRSGSLLRYISDDRELADIDVDGDERDTLVTKMWTIKESATKAWMTGLNVHPRFVKLSRQDRNRFAVHTSHPRMNLPSLSAVFYQAGDFLVAIAYKGAIEDEPTIHWVDASRVSAA